MTTLAIRWSSVRLCVRACVCESNLSNIEISETSWSIKIKFQLDHHWGRGLAAYGFWPDWIRTLVSMAADSSHRVTIWIIIAAVDWLHMVLGQVGAELWFP